MIVLRQKRPVGRRCPMLFRVCLIALVLLLSACAPTVKKAEKFLTPSVKSEKEMGRDFAKEAKEELPLIDDPEVIEFLHRVADPLVEATKPNSYHFRFHVVKSPAVNAFAVPGGHIYIYSGLILMAKNIHEMAGVMAHEMAHVKHRHTAQMVGKSTLVSIASMAAVVLAQGNQAASTGAMGAGQAMQLKYSREFEREADRSSIFYLYQAGYNPYGLLDYFNEMYRTKTFSTGKAPPYLLTHPLTPERMNQVDLLIRTNRLEVKNPREFKDFYRFQGKIYAEATDVTMAVPQIQQQLQDHPDDAKLWHKLGLIHYRNGWAHEALNAYVKALNLDPGLFLAWADLGALHARLGELDEAENDFKKAITIEPEHPTAYVYWGEMLLQADRPREALDMLQKAMEKDEHLIRVHELMAKAYKALKNDEEFHEQTAIFYEKMDRSEDAVKELKKALKLYGEKTEDGERITRWIERIEAS